MNKLLLKENHSSLNLYEKLCLLSEDQLAAIERGLEWTVKNCPDAVLVGGTAVVYHLTEGRNLTPDLDFMVHDINSVAAKLDEENTGNKPLFTGDKNDLGITVKDFNTDYLDAEKGNRELNKMILENAAEAQLGSYIINILQPELLAIMKLNLGRERDIDDGFALLGSGKCNAGKFKEYTDKLKNTLEEYHSIAQYEKLIPR